MTLSELAKNIGIKKYDSIPEGMLPYYPVPEERKNELCSIKMMERLQEKFNFFGEYFEIAKEYWLATMQDPARKAYLDAAGLFMKDGSLPYVRKIMGPELDGSPLNDFFYLFIHIPAIEKAYEEYLSRGFSPDDAKELMRNYYHQIVITDKDKLGRPALPRGYFTWLCLYTKCRIFKTGGFNFEIHKFNGAYILKNKKDGSLLPLCNNKPIHTSGLILGSAGAEDEKGSFVGTFEETSDAFLGYPAKAGRFQNQKETFSKSEWELAIRPGEDCMDVHIPRNCDISNEAFSAALESAKLCVKRSFPEFSPKIFACSSWLLSFELNEMLKPDSKILGFAERYTRYPIQDVGKSTLSFVFPKHSNGPVEDLPEDTSLRRAIKSRYVNGGFVYMYGGVIKL